MNYRVAQFINGQSYTEAQATTSPIYNPALGEVIGEVAFATPHALALAVTSASAAFTSWSIMPPLKRARILSKFKELLVQHQLELAQLVTQEHGKTLEDARGSIARGIELVEYMCAIPLQQRGMFSENVTENVDSYTMRQPVGICAGVSPFNFPVMVPLWMMIPAIACGNCFILKPSEQAPSAPKRLVELLTEAGLPAGVVNLLNGDKRIVDSLLHHPAIAAVTAVASTPVAEYIYKTAISYGKRCHTFGSAKNHGVVMPDADISQAADAIATAALGSTGQRCMALSVAVTIGNEVAEKLLAALELKFKAITIGAGAQPGVEMGPLISQQQLTKVFNYIASGLAEGATLRLDGRSYKQPQFPKGYFMGATLFDHVRPQMRIYQEEIFGPVLLVMRVPDLASAITLINDHPYGNGASLFTHDGAAAHTFTSQVQVGMVGINIAIPVPVAYHPFGGWKKSMFGDIAMHGEQSIQFYSKLKSVTTKWPKSFTESQGYVMPNH